MDDQCEYNKESDDLEKMMTRVKIMMGFSLVVAMIAFSATPALARFTNHGGKGSDTFGPTTFIYEGFSVQCGGASGSYKVNSEGTAVVEEGVAWKGCKSTIGVEAKVTCKGLEAKQPNKEGTEKGTARGTVTESCKAESEGCIITIGPEGNKELAAIALEKEAKEKTKTKTKIKIKEVTAETNGNMFCVLGGAKNSKTNGAGLEAESELAGIGLE